MSLEHQYAGFLDSKLLWKDNSLFELSQFKLHHSNIDTSKELSINIPHNEVLGKRIEHFFEHYINNSSHYKLILKSLQIFRNKITIGELDFIIEDLHNKDILHIELIYKFYLYNPEKSNIVLERWIGPNQNDSLLEKVTKLKEKQLPLLYRSETIKKLNELNIQANNINQKVCFFGNLFIPLSYQNKKIPHLNNDCIQGFWIHKKDFVSDKYGSLEYFIPQKKNWIIHPKHNKIWYTYTSILEQLQTQLHKKKSPLLWIKSNEDSFSKCFIVWW
ncbi:hypothetical protein SAMN04487910_2419 [Aquimarina amphilecti]|uniref:DUF1853 domain-containing protein n=1 Tax=Aquimarina amphilecti TaxID=1038014 RepID=A0A1H7Q3L9_AQUAM|nr:DUF1853 family protein [Aquimarina amphilecti]SEL42583.1 hypothetical protein SAMN04487910_2419 [Aquimarina amphilecti]